MDFVLVALGSFRDQPTGQKRMPPAPCARRKALLCRPRDFPASNTQVVIDNEAVTIKPDVAERYHKKQTAVAPVAGPAPAVTHGPEKARQSVSGTPAPVPPEQQPARRHGAVMISPERPAPDIHQIVEAIIEQPTPIPGADVSIKLESDADVSSGLDRAKVRTLVENATTLGCIDKVVM